MPCITVWVKLCIDGLYFLFSCILWWLFYKLKKYYRVIIRPCVIILQYMENENNFFILLFNMLRIKVIQLVHLNEILIRHPCSFVCFSDLDSYYRIFSESVRTVSAYHPILWNRMIYLWEWSIQTVKLTIHLNLVPKFKKRKA